MNKVTSRATLGHRNNRSYGDNAVNGRKIKDLLADEEPPETVVNKRKDPALDFSKFVIKTINYEYPRLGQIPATTYYSVISDMKVRIKEEKQILDVYYDLLDSYGRSFHILQSYPEGSQPFRTLAAALAAAGVPNDATADAGVGVREIITLDFVSRKSDLGSIVERRPYTPSAEDDADYDEDYDELTDEE